MREWREWPCHFTSRRGAACSAVVEGQKPGVHDGVRRHRNARERLAVRALVRPLSWKVRHLSRLQKPAAALSRLGANGVWARAAPGNVVAPGDGFVADVLSEALASSAAPGLAAILVIVSVATRHEAPLESGSRLSRAWPEAPQVLP